MFMLTERMFSRLLFLLLNLFFYNALVVDLTLVMGLAVKTNNGGDRRATDAAATTGCDAITDNNNGCFLVLGLGRVGREVARQAHAQQLFPLIMGTTRSRSAAITTTTATTTDQSSSSTKEADPWLQRLIWDPAALLHASSQQSSLSLRSIIPRQHVISHVLITLPPPADAEERRVVENELDALIDDCLAALLPSDVGGGCRWIGVVSTSGVYGDHDGACVTEDSPLLGHDDATARLYRAYANAWRTRIMERTAGHYRLRIFRCAGIYGPDRSALHTAFRQAGVGAEERPPVGSSPPLRHDVTNRIHVSDIAKAIVASMRIHNGCNNRNDIDQLDDDDHDDDEAVSARVRVYNLADNRPESRSVVLQHATRLLESIGALPLPSSHVQQPFTDQITTHNNNNNNTRNVVNDSEAIARDDHSAPSQRRRRRRLDRKLVSNHRMNRELLTPENGGCLTYPTYREGLHSILMDPSAPWWEKLLPEQSRTCDQRQ